MGRAVVGSGRVVVRWCAGTGAAVVLASVLDHRVAVHELKQSESLVARSAWIYTPRSTND